MYLGFSTWYWGFHLYKLWCHFYTLKGQSLLWFSFRLCLDLWIWRVEIPFPPSIIIFVIWVPFWINSTQKRSAKNKDQFLGFRFRRIIAESSFPHQEQSTISLSWFRCWRETVSDLHLRLHRFAHLLYWHTSSWLEKRVDHHCCKWNGLYCNNKTRRVTKIWLTANDSLSN